jgi:hypothetical protein
MRPACVQLHQVVDHGERVLALVEHVPDQVQRHVGGQLRDQLAQFIDALVHVTDHGELRGIFEVNGIGFRIFRNIDDPLKYRRHYRFEFVARLYERQLVPVLAI